MSLFDTILSAVNNPALQGSQGDLGAIAGVVQQLSSTQGLDAGTVNDVVGIVGKYLKGGLQETRNSSGEAGVAEAISQFAGTNPNPNALSALLSGPQAEQLIQEIANRTGLDAQAIEGFLPTIVPIVLKLLGLGSENSPGGANSGGNSVVSAFLDGDGDGDVDLADALRLAGQFTNR